MENIFNYLRGVFQDLKSETTHNPLFLALIFVLITIPLGYAFGGIAIGLFVLTALITFNKSNFKINRNLIFPIFLYLLMVLSILWSSDINATFKALSKTLPLFVIPLCFLIAPSFSNQQKQKITSYFSYAMLFFTVYCLIKATIKYSINQNADVFFYHELVTKDVNAIHVSVFISVACFYFMTKPNKTNLDRIAIALMMMFIFFLSSKNITIIFIILILVYFLRHNKLSQTKTVLKAGLFLALLLVIGFTGKIKDRILLEIETNFSENRVNQSIGDAKNKVYNVSVKQAWSEEEFKPNDFFPGTAFRVYQIRIFKEMLHEDPILFTGYGLNATDFKIAEKGIEHNIYLGDATHEGYQKMNFHNQYIQIFAELGILGLVLLVIMLYINLKNALQKKDFVVISFAVLMISLFLTESFLSRQRGVIFFIVLYCLFNSEAIPRKGK